MYKVGIITAITALEGESLDGLSSRQAIKKHIEEANPSREWANGTFLEVLKNMVAAGDLVQVKGSYKFSADFKKKVAASAMAKLQSGRHTATNGVGDGDGAASKDAAIKKRSAAEEHEEDAKQFKKAKPSVCKAAEELVCPILQGLPIDPVIAEDVSDLRHVYHTSVVLFHLHRYFSFTAHFLINSA